jgi:hypothetical protein
MRLLKSEFTDWLTANKNLTRRSALDVVSRSRRLAKMLDLDDLTAFSEDHLAKCRAFGRLAPTVKSQLKRAAQLLLEYERVGGTKRKRLAKTNAR